MNFTGINFTLVPDNSYAYIAFDLEYGFRLLEERRDTNAVYFRDLEDPDLDGISNNPVTDSALIVKSNIIDYSGSLAPLESRVGELIKIGDVWATVLSYNSTKSITVDNHPIRLPAIQSIENNSINIPSHGLNNGEAIKFYAISPPMGIVPGTTYYVRDTSTDSFKIAASAGGAALSISGAIIGEFYASKIYSIFTPTLNYDVIKDTIIGKVFRTGAFYTVETFYNVSGESITSFELVDALPASGDYEGQVVLYDNTLYTWNGVSWVTSSGESARTVSLSATQQAFDYTSNGNKVGTPTSTVTATAFGTTGTLTYVFKVDGTVVTGSGNTYLYTPNSSFDEMPDIVTVDLYEDGLLVASDLITMFGVIEGGDAITVILSNEAHTIPTDSAGNNGVFTGSGTTIKVFRGNTPLNYVSGGTTSSFDVSVINGPTVSGSTSVTGTGTATATIGDLTGISASTGLRDITVTVYFDGATTTFSKVQSFSKSLAGAAGANSVIYYVDTSASAIKRNLDGTLTPSTVTFSAFSITGNNSPVAYAGRFIVRRNGTAVYTSDDDEATYVYTPTTPASLTDVKVELYLAGGTTTLLDQETLPVVQDGSSAITVSVDNDNLSFAGPVTGYVGIAFGSATSTTRVYRGSTLLDYAASGANTWNVTAQSSTGVTVATPTGSGTTYVVPVPTAMSADSAFTDLTIAVRDQAGVASTFNARITYSLSRAGAAGANSVIYYVDTSASAIKRNLDGTLTPSTVTFSAFSITGNNSPVAYAGRFIVRRNGTAVYTSDDDEATYVYTPTTPASLTDVKVELYLAGGTTTLLDQETLPVVQDGSSAITVSVDNDNLSFAGPVTGYVGIAFGSATSTTRVYRGSTLLDYAASGANTWNVTAQSSTGVTVATPTGSGTTYVVPVPTAMSADSAFTDLTIAVRDQAGVASTFNARITYSLSRAGAAGGTGPTGPTGTQALIAYGIGNSNYAFSGSTVVIGAATSPPANASIVYNFASNVEGFTTAGSGSSLSQSNGALIWTAASDSRILSPTLDLPGASISKIRIRLRATSANPTWEGIIYYTTPGHGESGLYYGVIPPPVIPIVQSTYYIVDVDMSNLGPNGGTDWIDSTINSIRFDISDSSSTWEIDWIALGSNFAGTMPASGDWGLTTSWTPTPQTLTTNGTSLYQVTGLFNPTTDQTIWTGYPYLSSLKVGQLSAIAANIGEVTAGLVRNSTNTMRVDLDNGRIVFDNGVVMKITGNGFGSTNQFLEWTGPSQAINLCTEANGFLWIKTNGDAYFGGSLSIGTLTTKAATSSLANNAETETATFGSNGGTIVIAHSFNRGYNSASYSPTNISNSSGTATFGLSLSRSLAGGAYSVVDTLTVNCPWSVTNQGFEPELGYLITRSLGGSGSKSYTDPTNSTQTRQYKLAITSLTGVSGSGALVNSQLLSIIASEE